MSLLIDMAFQCRARLELCHDFTAMSAIHDGLGSGAPALIWNTFLSCTASLCSHANLRTRGTAFLGADNRRKDGDVCEN